MAASTRSYPERVQSSLGSSPHVQRTLSWLSNERVPRRRVRILFYGQSFSEQNWWRDIASELRRHYPRAELEIENRALGGFPAQLLVKTAETDVYPYYPDLIVFHAFGAHDKYEELVRAVRMRTTAELLLQNDYVMRVSELWEERHTARLEPHNRHWDAFMNYQFLPAISTKYETGLCDHRDDFKAYLRAHHLPPEAMLLSDRHLNSFGEWLVHQGVKECLRKQDLPTAGRGGLASEAWIRSYRAGDGIEERQGRLRLVFRGNRVDAILAQGGSLAARIWIDGQAPSTRAELYAFTRALPTPGGKWPALLRVGTKATPRIEEWTLDVRTGERHGAYTFSLRGSHTGFDGSGTSDVSFVSNSGRVVIEPADWNLEYALSLSGIKVVPERVNVSFGVRPMFVDRVMPVRHADASREQVVTLVQGLSNSEHVLEIESGAAIARIRELRVYTPPGAPP